jgi:hypothetical protein
MTLEPAVASPLTLALIVASLAASMEMSPEPVVVREEFCA